MKAVIITSYKYRGFDIIKISFEEFTDDINNSIHSVV